ncbi:hypothetical protein J4Q44_G00290330, partial [Coregonus suidteri]
ATPPRDDSAVTTRTTVQERILETLEGLDKKRAEEISVATDPFKECERHHSHPEERTGEG